MKVKAGPRGPASSQGDVQVCSHSVSPHSAIIAQMKG